MNNLFQFLQSNFLKLSCTALFVGALWIGFAVSYALFRDTTDPAATMAKASAMTVDAAAAKLSRNAADGHQYWFRQRTTKPFTVPVEQALAQRPTR